MRSTMLALLALAAAGGCAFQDPANTPLLTALDSAVKPQTRTGKIALGAAMVPAGVVCGALDIAVVHPAHSTWLAGGDTYRLLWARSKGSFAEEALVFIPKVAFSPVVFGFAWLGRGFFRAPHGEAGPQEPRLVRRRDVRSSAGLSFLNRRNRRLMNAAEDALIPESTAGRILVAPVALPLCLVAGIADALVVHPIASLDDVWRDTEDLAWRRTERGYATECAVAPLRAVGTPVGLGAFFASRFLFDAPPWPPDPAQLERELMEKNAKTRLLAATAQKRDAYSGADAGPATAAMLKAARTYPADTEFCVALMIRLPRPLTEDAESYLVKMARTGRGKRCAAAIERLFIECATAPGSTPEADARGQHMVNTLARLYDDLVAAGHHEAEVYLALLAGMNVGVERPFPSVLALHILRSLAARGWPTYAALVAFQNQWALFREYPPARIDAVTYEWPALRLARTWPDWVVRKEMPAVRQADTPEKRAARQQVLAVVKRNLDAAAAQLGNIPPGRAADLLLLTNVLAFHTHLDAAATAEKLLSGPPADLDLFLRQPLDLLERLGDVPTEEPQKKP